MLAPEQCFGFIAKEKCYVCFGTVNKNCDVLVVT